MINDEELATIRADLEYASSGIERLVGALTDGRLQGVGDVDVGQRFGHMQAISPGRITRVDHTAYCCDHAYSAHNKAGAGRTPAPLLEVPPRQL